jgi:2'-hydroxyisoflavone reductase
MPGRVANLRPGLIVGPEDRSDRFTYWPVRVGQGGEVLAPGDPEQEVQFIDVRDLGDYCVSAGMQAVSGPRNAVGFRMRLGFEEFLHGCKCALNADARFTWVDEEFLRAQRVRPYLEMPLWLPSGMRGHFANALAFADGMRCRPVSDTVQATAAWYAEQWPDGRPWERAGMKPERERELLAAWHEGR